MSIGKMVALVCALSAVGAIAGAGIGWWIGTYTPSLYITLFQDVRNPTEFGAGIGLANGVIMGFILGIVVIVCASFGKRNER
jgi:hypothetical protein